jgi:hypothetical protein
MARRPLKRPRAAPPPERASWLITTIRLTTVEWNALRQAALARAMASGGKPDASAILRELVDRWIREGAT